MQSIFNKQECLWRAGCAPMGEKHGSAFRVRALYLAHVFGQYLADEPGQLPTVPPPILPRPCGRLFATDPKPWRPARSRRTPRHALRQLPSTAVAFRPSEAQESSTWFEVRQGHPCWRIRSPTMVTERNQCSPGPSRARKKELMNRSCRESTKHVQVICVRALSSLPLSTPLGQ